MPDEPLPKMPFGAAAKVSDTEIGDGWYHFDVDFAMILDCFLGSVVHARVIKA